MKFYMVAFLSAAIVASNFVVHAQEEAVQTVVTKQACARSLTQGDCLDLFNVAASQVQIGGVYFSSYNPEDLFEVLTIALDTNGQPVVVYQALFGINAVWVRPVSEWVASVEVDGVAVPHFQLVDESCDVVVTDKSAEALLEEVVAQAAVEVASLENEVASDLQSTQTGTVLEEDLVVVGNEVATEATTFEAQVVADEAVNQAPVATQDATASESTTTNS